jgi:transposase
MNKRYRVRLTETEREHLEVVVSKGKAAAYKIKHAHILLKVDASGPQWTDERVAEAFGCHRRTVANVRQRFVEQGLESALERKPRLTPGRQPVCDGEAEAKLIALRCGPPPEGHGRWTLRLLADRAVQLEIVPTLCHETVRQVLKKRLKAAPAEAVRDSA